MLATTFFAIGGVDIVNDDLGAFFREMSRYTASKSCAPLL